MGPAPAWVRLCVGMVLLDCLARADDMCSLTQKSATITCNYNGEERHLQKGSYENADVILISNSTRLTIGEDFLTSNRNLKSISFIDMDLLIIKKQKWNGLIPQVLESVTVNGVKEVRLEGGAFSNWWSNNNITITNAKKCHIAGSAFSSTSKSPAMSKVLLQNIELLEFDSGAFRSYIKDLVISNVKMECEPETFNGRIVRLSLLNVDMFNVHPGCAVGSAGWDTLEIDFSNVSNIGKYAFQGRINTVEIRNSHIKNIKKNGIFLSVRKFSVTNCTIDLLPSKALAVNAIYISLKSSNVFKLQKDAFGGIQITDKNGQGIVIKAINVTQAEEGSLSFTNSVSVTLRDFLIRDPCECKSFQKILPLVLGTDMPVRPLTESQINSVCHVYPSISCLHNEQAISMQRYESTYCSSDSNDRNKCALTEVSGSGQSLQNEVQPTKFTSSKSEASDIRPANGQTAGHPLVPYLVAGVVALLLVLTLLVLVIWLRKKHQKGKHVSGSSTNPNLSCEADISASDLQRMASPSTTSEPNDANEDGGYCMVFPRASGPDFGTEKAIYAAVSGDQGRAEMLPTADQESQSATEDYLYAEIHPQEKNRQEAARKGDEDIAVEEHTYEDISEFRLHSTMPLESLENPPVYAQVSKCKPLTPGKDLDSESIPVYAQVVKREQANADKPRRETSETHVYAQVFKNTVKKSNNEAVTTSFWKHATGSASDGEKLNLGQVPASQQRAPAQELAEYAEISMDSRGAIRDDPHAEHLVDNVLYEAAASLSNVLRNDVT